MLINITFRFLTYFVRNAVTTQVYFRQDLQDKQDYCSFGIFCYAQAGRRAGGFLGHLLSGTEESEGFWSRTW